MGVTVLLPPLPLAFIFDSASPGEWFVLAVVIMIVVGPKRLPEVARKLGHTMELFRRAAEEFKTQLMTMDQEQTPPPPETTMTSESQNDPDLSGYQHYPDDATYPGNEHAMDGTSDDGSHVAHDDGAITSPDTASVPTPDTPALASQKPLTQEGSTTEPERGRGQE